MSFTDLIHDVDMERLVVRRVSVIHRIDARVKILSALALIVGVIFMRCVIIPLFIFITATIVAIGVLRIPLRTYLNRLIVMPFSVAGVVFLVYVLTQIGDKEIASFFGLRIYEESLHFAVLLFARIVASVSVLNIIVMTTPLNDAVRAMLWFRVPRVMVDIAVMMLRYVHLLSVEAVRMYRAQVSRCGFAGNLSYRQKLMNIGTIAGALMLRAFKRGERVYIAMLSRGYSANSQIIQHEPMSAKDALTATAIIALTVGLVFIDFYFLCAVLIVRCCC